MSRRPFAGIRDKSFLLDGGYDLTSSHLTKNPGAIIDGYNVEMVAGVDGYSVVGGFERCAGAVPSKITIYYMAVDLQTGSFVVGDILTRGSKTCVVLADESPDADQEDFPIYDNYTVIPVATFDTLVHNTDYHLDPIYPRPWVGASCTVNFCDPLDGADYYTAEEIRAFTIIAVDGVRADIEPWDSVTHVPAGGFSLRGENYLLAVYGLYKGVGVDWESIVSSTVGPTVMFFTEGVLEIEVGDEIVVDTLTTTARSVTTTGGAYNGAAAPADQATGYITVDQTTWHSASDETLTVGGTTSCTVSHTEESYFSVGNPSYIEALKYNFTNLVDGESIFCVNGTSHAFEFDGTNIIPIYGPEGAVGYPTHLNVHQGRLQLVYPGGDMAYSVSGQPRVNNADLGSGVWSTGSEIIKVATIHGNAAAIFCENALWFLLGDGIYSELSATRNWQFFEHASAVSCAENSVVSDDQVYFVSGSDIRTIQATDTSASYDTLELTPQVRKYLETHKGNILSSCWCKDKSQYRLFFSGGYALYLTVKNRKVRGATPVLFPFGVKSCWTTIDSGVESIFFINDEDGYLKKMDSGISFDGEPIAGFFRTPPHNYGSVRIEKHFPGFTIELGEVVTLGEGSTLSISADFNFNKDPLLEPPEITFTPTETDALAFAPNDGHAGYIYSGTLATELDPPIEGYGYNMSILITFSMANSDTLSFMSATVDYKPLKRKQRK